MNVRLILASFLFLSGALPALLADQPLERLPRSTPEQNRYARQIDTAVAEKNWDALKASLLALFTAILAPCTLAWSLPWPAWLSILLAMKLLWGLVFESLFARILLAP